MPNSEELRYCINCAMTILNGENGDPDNFLIRVIDEADCKHDLSGD